MSVLNIMLPGLIEASIPLKPGITPLPDVTIIKDGTIPSSSVVLGATMKSRTLDDTANAEGKEVIDERWIEANKGAGWVPIGGGPGGDVIPITATTTFQMRVNVPGNPSTTGDFVANVEQFYIE